MLAGARGSDGDVPPSNDVEWECRSSELDVSAACHFCLSDNSVTDV